MIHTIIRKNTYQDSINLMLLTNSVSTTEGVNKVQVMMATPANKDIFKDAGLYTEELEKAEPNDMAIAIDTGVEGKVDEVLEKVDQYLQDQSIKADAESFQTVRTWDKAQKAVPDANIALISVPGEYAAEEAENALDKGMHAFIFSDNVPMDDEVRIKQKADENGLVVMGPDSGTGILDGIPMAFANVVKKGKIGVVGASGTGIQEVTTIIDRHGEGISHAIGTGGRDLKDPVGAITMKEGIKALENHNATDIIVVVSKPPAKEVRDDVVDLLQNVSKPVVTIFLGEKPDQHEGNVYQAYTLEETARIAVDLAKEKPIKEDYNSRDYSMDSAALQEGQTAIKGFYSGGTLASEAAVLLADTLDEGSVEDAEGYVLKAGAHEIYDLGDDEYTQGKPHPMIDPETRSNFIREAGQDRETAVILLDVVLGYGSHDDMASALLPALKQAKNDAENDGRTLNIIATVCGTLNDPQNYNEQRKQLEDAGMIVKDTNNQAVRTALHIIGKEVNDVKKTHVDKTAEKSFDLSVSEDIADLVNTKPRVINVGLKSFANAINDFGGRVVQYDWRPIAGGDERMRKILSLLK